jgi:tetratricopeptide (TPR) repeat protein
MKKKNEVKNWLVKSSGHILGPYSFEEVCQGLRDKNVAPIDEVRTPEIRWTFVRESKDFAELIKELQVRKDSRRDDTHGTDSHEHTITRTMEIPQDKNKMAPPPVPAEFMQADSRSMPAPFSQSSGSMDGAVDRSAKDKSNLNPPPLPKLDIPLPPKRRSLEKKSTPWPAIVVGVVAVVALGIWKGTRLFRPDVSKIESAEDLLRDMRKMKNVGAYDQFLEKFDKLEKLNRVDAGVTLEFAPIFIAFDRNLDLVQKTLQQSFSNSHQPGPVLRQNKNHLAMIYLQRRQFDQAKNILEKVNQEDSEFIEVAANLATLKILQGDYRSGIDMYNSLNQKGLSDSLISLQRSITHIEWSLRNKSEDKMKAAITELEYFAKNILEYRSRAWLLLSYARYKQNSGDLQKSLQQFLDSMVMEEMRMPVNLELSSVLISWSRLTPYCDQMLSKKDGLAEAGWLVDAVQIHCHYLAGEKVSAFQNMEQLFQRSPTNAVLAGLVAWYALQDQKPSQAMEYLKSSPNTSLLGHAVRAQICEQQGEFACAEEQWNQLKDKDDKAALAYEGLARVALRQKNLTKASSFIQAGLEKNPQHSGLNLLSGEIQSAKKKQ